MPARSARRAASAAALAGFALAAAPTRGATQPPPRPAAAGRPTYTAADVQFMSAMIGHHAQAVAMSRMADSHGAAPGVRTLAARIINAQQDEIAIMQQWLRDRGQPVPQPSATGAHAMAGMSTPGMSTPGMSTPGMSTPGVSGDEHAGMHHDAAMSGMAMPGTTTPRDSAPGAAMPAMPAMPGMLTAAQMAALDRARGREFDRLFLSGMIQHHRGAVGMVQTLFGTYGAGQDEAVFKFASDVNVDQTTEIARMQQMLAAVLFGES